MNPGLLIGAGLGLFLTVAVLAVVGPLLTIAALNTLFGLGIPYTFWTWLSTLWLVMLVSSRASVKAKR